MAKLNFDDSDGVWRTIGGRRVFIREGQSLSDAMKKSGKFKSAKKKEKEEENVKEQIKEDKKQDLNIDPYEHAENIKEPKNEFDKLAKEYKNTHDEMTKYNTERKHLYQGFDEEKAKDHLSEKDYKRYKELTEKYENERQKLRDITDKMEKTPREEMKEQEEQSWRERFKNDKEYRESVINKISGEKEKKEIRDFWEKEDQKKNSVKEKELSKINDKISKGEVLTEEEFTKKIREIQSTPSYKKKMDEAVEELNKKYDYNNKKGSNEKYTVDYFKEKGVDVKDKIPEGWQKLEGATTAPKGYEWYSNGKSRFGGEYKNALIKTSETKTSDSINNTLRRKAYQKYLKEHPSSKMTFEDFKDMNKLK